MDDFLKTVAPYISMAAGGAKGVSGFVAAGRNADIAQAEGRQAIMASQEEAARVRRQVAQQQARVRAQAGGDLSGSSLEILLENAKQGELMAQDKLYAGQLTAWAKKRQAAQYRTAGLFGLADSAASIAGMAVKQIGDKPDTSLTTRASSFDSWWGG